MREALRRLWPHTLLGVLLLLALGLHSLGALLWGLPFLLGLALAVPFGLLTAGPRFSALLRRHGRDGVPLYLLYPPGGGEPAVLPQILTEATLRAALGGT